MVTFDRRQILGSLGAVVAGAASACRTDAGRAGSREQPAATPIRLANGEVDWRAVRELFPLTKEWTHLASFLLASHPRPVAEAIDRFRKKLDSDPAWIEQVAVADSEGHPYTAVKRSLAEYVGGRPEDVCLTSNTTSALAIAYHGLRIRPNQTILTTEHDHYSHHESIRYAAERSGCRVQYVSLYDDPRLASTSEMTARLARAITPGTRAVGITWVHSSTGVKVPIAPIAEAVAQANRGRANADRCLLIVDGVHGFGNQVVSVAGLGCDFFASGAHKWLLGPRGTGFLWGRSDAWPELRPTIPSFDPDAQEPWEAWMERKPLPPTKAWFVSPGGFLAFEYVLAVPAAVELHKTIGRDRIADRLHELNTAFREGAASIPGVTLHTPRARDVSAGISCYEIVGLSADEVTERLMARKIRTSSSPYKVSYARVAVGVMNTLEDVELVLREIRALAPKSAAA
jgi:selenocysteine lyase/cysteine desulfurase